MLIWDHHPGYIDKATFERNQARLASNTRPRAHEPGGAVREGQALLQGIAVCGRCGRKLKVHYQGTRGHQESRLSLPRQRAGRGTRGVVSAESAARGSSEAVAARRSQALTPAGVKAALRAAEALEADHDAALAQWRAAGRARAL